MAEILGLSLENGEDQYVTVGDGSQIKVCIHKVTCKLVNLTGEPEGEEFKASIGFSRHLGIGFNIIGRLDIFDRFIVCFNESEKSIEFAALR